MNENLCIKIADYPLRHCDSKMRMLIQIFIEKKQRIKACSKHTTMILL